MFNTQVWYDVLQQINKFWPIYDIHTWFWNRLRKLLCIYILLLEITTYVDGISILIYYHYRTYCLYTWRHSFQIRAWDYTQICWKSFDNFKCRTLFTQSSTSEGSMTRLVSLNQNIASLAFRAAWVAPFYLFRYGSSEFSLGFCNTVRSRGLLSPNNSQETPIVRPWGRGMGVFHGFLVWPKFYLRI